MFRKSRFLIINKKIYIAYTVLEFVSILLHTEIRPLQNIKCYTVKDILAMFFWKSFQNIDKFVHCSWFCRITSFLVKAQ